MYRRTRSVAEESGRTSNVLRSMSSQRTAAAVRAYLVTEKLMTGVRNDRSVGWVDLRRAAQASMWPKVLVGSRGRTYPHLRGSSHAVRRKRHRSDRLLGDARIGAAAPSPALAAETRTRRIRGV